MKSLWIRAAGLVASWAGSAAAWEPVNANAPNGAQWTVTTISDIATLTADHVWLLVAEDPTDVCRRMYGLPPAGARPAHRYLRLYAQIEAGIPLALFARANNARVMVRIGPDGTGTCMVEELRTCFDAAECRPLPF